MLRIIDQSAVRLVYQPIVDARTHQVRAYEALCRPDSERFTNPGALFDAAMQSGDIWRLSRLIRRIAASDIAKLDAGLLLFVNLHPADIDDPEFLDGVPAVCAIAKRVVFEVTERASIPDFQRFADNIKQLRRHGYRFALDDLGAGYASLNAVALFEPDFIKVDMALIRNLDSQSGKSRIVKHIVGFAVDAKATVVAEGVETEAEVSTATALGCDLLQGYYFAKPGPPFVRI